MTRQRKAASKTDSGPVPLTSPSKLSPRSKPAKPLIEITEDEQWRLINQSGILQNRALVQESIVESTIVEEEGNFSLCDEVFNAVLLIIPFSSLLLLMIILIHHQYGKTASLEIIMEKMVPGIPILSLFIFYTNRHKQHRRMQFLLFIISIVVGSRMIYQFNHASWLVNMNQCPPLATIWIYTIIQLELIPAFLNLAVVGTFVWWKGLKILQ
ncbi:hypothetical protein BYT27DRAFT_7182803 [Phlegmacium glaucopus]|nr:hypothetical protein BYT27DRAFT_7182803 [Phlegmacium glaucopus]